MQVKRPAALVTRAVKFCCDRRCGGYRVLPIGEGGKSSGRPNRATRSKTWMKNLCALALMTLAEAWLLHKGAFATATAIIALAIALALSQRLRDFFARPCRRGTSCAMRLAWALLLLLLAVVLLRLLQQAEIYLWHGASTPQDVPLYNNLTVQQPDSAGCVCPLPFVPLLPEVVNWDGDKFSQAEGEYPSTYDVTAAVCKALAASGHLALLYGGSAIGAHRHHGVIPPEVCC